MEWELEKLVIKKKRGGTLTRSETVSIRMNPKIRFAAELAARASRRSLSSLIELILEEGLYDFDLFTSDDKSRYRHQVGAKFVVDDIWDVDESDRFVNLARRYPELLTLEEESLWKLIREYCGLEKPSRNDDIDSIYFIDHFARPFIRSNWELFNRVAIGEADIKELPRIN